LHLHLGVDRVLELGSPCDGTARASVLVRYPADSRQPASDRQAWPWLAGTIEQQCGPDEWLVTIEDRRVAELEDGSPAPAGTPDGDLLFPQCYRDSSELRPVPPSGLEAGQ
jgi:hypothetical protein